MNEQNKQNLSLGELIEETRKHLRFLNYSQDTLRHLNGCWSTLESYAKANGTEYFTTEFGHQFLWEKYKIAPFGKENGSHRRCLRRAITILSDYQRCGIIYKRQPTKLHVWPPEYSDVCESFLDAVVRNRLAASSQRQYRVQLERFTGFLIKNEVKSIASVTAETVDNYLATYIGYKKCTISYACYILKTFFTYALVNDYIKNDLVKCIPAVKVDCRRNLPSVFTKDEIEALLKAVDRHNPQGKRDYAILLLAVRYGMRVGDITSLKLSSLDFEAKKINFSQNKTGTQMSFNMLQSVGWALIDYLENARPKTESPNVFVRLIPPYDAFGNNNNLGSIMDRYLSRAGIVRKNNKHYGMHTIRHSFASHLLEKGHTIHDVADALGHLEPNSSMIYTKVDLPMLELCALEVPYDNE